MSALDPTVMALADGQHSMLTTRQLRIAGKGPLDISSLVRRGVLHHPARGLYSVATLASEDAHERHRQLVAGAFLLYPDAVLTGVSALLSHGIDVWGADLGKPEIVRPCHRGGGVEAVRVRRVSSRPEQVDSPWGPSVPIGEAIVQLAIDNGIVPGVVSADCALRTEVVTEDEIVAAVERTRSWPGASQARAVLDFMDGRRENVAESPSAVTLMFGGFDLVPQVSIWDNSGRFIGRVDFKIKNTRVVIEFDGKIKYAGDDGTALFREKIREDELRALGYIVVRITWADLENPARLIAKVNRALRLAATSG